MRVSKAQVEANRETILENAGRLFREKGFDGVGVAELMKASGLTNGAFYGHFASKDELIEKACERVMGGGHDPWAGLEAGETSLGDFVAGYLSEPHRKHPGQGCLFAALGPEVARQGRPVRRAFTESLKGRIAALGRAMRGRKREDALVGVSALVGALVLARAVDDPELAQELMSATAKVVGG